MAQPDQGGGDEPADRRSPGRRPKPLDAAEFAGRPRTWELLQAVRAVVDADPPGRKRGTTARMLGLTASELSGLLSGRKVLQHATLDQLCREFDVDEETQQRLQRMHTAAFMECPPRMRPWVQQTDDAVAQQRETQQQCEQLQAEIYQVQADHRALLGRHQDLQSRHQDLVELHRGTAQKLADVQQAARLERERHRRDAADHSARLEREKDAHATTRHERDQARRDSAGQCERLITVQAELLILRERDQQRSDASVVPSAAHSVVSAERTSPPVAARSGAGSMAVTAAADGVGAQSSKPRGQLVLAVTTLALAVVLIGSALIAFHVHLPLQPHDPYNWLIGAGFFTLMFGLLGLVLYYEDGKSHSGANADSNSDWPHAMYPCGQ